MLAKPVPCHVGRGVAQPAKRREKLCYRLIGRLLSISPGETRRPSPGQWAQLFQDRDRLARERNQIVAFIFMRAAGMRHSDVLNQILTTPP